MTAAVGVEELMTEPARRPSMVLVANTNAHRAGKTAERMKMEIQECRCGRGHPAMEEDEDDEAVEKRWV